MSPRTARCVGSSAAGASIISTALGQLLLLASGSTAVGGHVSPVIKLAFPGIAIVGALIISRQHRNLLGWLLVFEGFSAALTATDSVTGTSIMRCSDEMKVFLQVSGLLG